MSAGEHRSARRDRRKHERKRQRGEPSPARAAGEQDVLIHRKAGSGAETQQNGVAGRRPPTPASRREQQEERCRQQLDHLFADRGEEKRDEVAVDPEAVDERFAGQHRKRRNAEESRHGRTCEGSRADRPPPSDDEQQEPKRPRELRDVAEHQAGAASDREQMRRRNDQNRERERQAGPRERLENTLRERTRERRREGHAQRFLAAASSSAFSMPASPFI